MNDFLTVAAPFLLAVAVAGFTLNALMTRAFQLKFPGRTDLLRIYQSLFCLVATLSFGLSQGRFTWSPKPFLTGALFGVFYFSAVICSSTCYEIGSMSLTSIITNMSLFIPLMWSCFVMGEPVKPLQLVGIGLIVATFLLAVNRSGGENGSSGGEGVVSLRWAVIVTAAFLSNGVTAVIQKSYVADGGESTVMQFMSVAYLTAAVGFALNAAVLYRRGKTRTAVAEPSAADSVSSASDGVSSAAALGIVLTAVLSGLGSFGGNALMGLICTRISGAIMYPCINGGLCVVTAICSFVIFHERPVKRKIAAIVTGVCAIILLNI